MLAVVAAALLAAPHAAHGQVACRYEVAAVIQAPPGGLGTSSATTAAAISPNGRYVVGHYVRPFIVDDPRAFCYDMQTGQFISLPLPANGWQSYANDVSDSGIVVGSYWVTGGAMPQRGYLFDLANNSYIAELLPYPGASWCTVTGINASGTVCGTRSIGSKGDPVNPQTAFIWSAKNDFTDLGLMNGQSTVATDINDAGIALGAMTEGGITVSFRWNGSEFNPLPAVLGHSTLGRRLKADGTVVGVAFLSPPPPPIPTRAFSENDGVVTILLPFAGLNNSTAVDRTDDGQILGSCVGLSSEIIPTLWRNQVPIRLSDLIIGSVPMTQQPIGASANGLLLVPSGSRACVLRGRAALGDLNSDCIVGVADLIGVIVEWGQAKSPADFSGDGVVNEQDLLIVVANWSA